MACLETIVMEEVAQLDNGQPGSLHTFHNSIVRPVLVERLEKLLAPTRSLGWLHFKDRMEFAKLVYDRLARYVELYDEMCEEDAEHGELEEAIRQGTNSAEIRPAQRQCTPLCMCALSLAMC